MSDRIPILIAGAGPAGLVLAYSLARQGAPFRIVDPKSGPVSESRAMGVQARTLEFYDQFGIADEAIALGVPASRAHLRSGGREVTSFSLEEMGEGISPHPFMLCLAQDVHERFLVEKLEELGVAIEWGTRLDGFERDGEGVTAALSGPNGGETVRADWIVGCEGARSVVRRGLDLAFEGGTNEGLFYVADIDVEGHDAGSPDAEAGRILASLDETTVALMMPVRTSGTQRVLGIVPRDLADRAARTGSDLTWEGIRQVPEAALGIRATALHWFSTYKVSHRVAEHFRVGRAFLAGDAGHIHSPVGGQGMNTGIGDAVNLGWKLAAVVRGRADASLLDSYEPERIAFARKLISTTDEAFGPMASNSFMSRMLRAYIAPNAARVLLHLPWLPQLLFRTVSQTRINYRESALSAGEAGDVRGGDRMPWVREAANFAPLASLRWQVHVHGSAEPALGEAARALGLAVETFKWSAGAKRAGLARDAAYLVRPDGYVALALPNQEAAALRDHVAACGLRLEAS